MNLLPSTVHGLRSTVYSPWSSVHRPPSTVFIPPSSTTHDPSTINYQPSTIPDSRISTPEYRISNIEYRITAIKHKSASDHTQRRSYYFSLITSHFCFMAGCTQHSTLDGPHWLHHLEKKWFLNRSVVMVASRRKAGCTQYSKLDGTHWLPHPHQTCQSLQLCYCCWSR